VTKSPEEIATFIAGLSQFDKDILTKNYTTISIDANSDSAAIKKAQLGLALNGVVIPVD
jgi:hypothetical protein